MHIFCFRFTLTLRFPLVWVKVSSNNKSIFFKCMAGPLDSWAFRIPFIFRYFTYKLNCKLLCTQELTNVKDWIKQSVLNINAFYFIMGNKLQNYLTYLFINTTLSYSNLQARHSNRHCSYKGTLAGFFRRVISERKR